MLNLQSKLKVSEDSALSEDLRIARSKKNTFFWLSESIKRRGKESLLCEDRLHIRFDRLSLHFFFFFFLLRVGENEGTLM